MAATTLNVLTGCVKWFNSTLNYGFITVLTEGETKNTDIFCHQSNIKTKQDCYRSLVAGECVQFQIEKVENGKHPTHAINISGFNGGLLQCENSELRKSFRSGDDRRRTVRGDDRRPRDDSRRSKFNTSSNTTQPTSK